MRYPKGRVYEDIGTTYKLFLNAETVVLTGKAKYYYYRHENSIVAGWSLKSLVDRCWCTGERYLEIKEKYPVLSDVALLQYHKSMGILKETIIKNEYIEVKKNKLEIKESVYPFLKENEKDIFRVGQASKLNKLGHKIFLKSLFLYKHTVLPTRRIKKYLDKTRAMTEVTIEEAFKESRIYKPLLDKNQKILIMGSADYENLGDHAISYAQKEFLQDVFPEYTVIEIFNSEIRKYAKQIKHNLTKEDLIVIQGGGNFGDIYPWAEEIRRLVIREFTENRIFLFPQTLQFQKNEQGRAELLRSQEIYKEHHKLVLIARDKVSYKQMQKVFAHNKVLLVPDIVLYLNKSNDVFNREDKFLLCLRNDLEGSLKKDDIYDIRNVCFKYCKQISFTDTVEKHNVSLSKRNYFLQEKWLEFKTAKFVVTDRLHGMIFAAITGTPCIAFGNFNHKLESSYEWLKDLEYIQFVNNLEEFEKVLQDMNLVKRYTYPKDYLKKHYNTLAVMMKDL